MIKNSFYFEGHYIVSSQGYSKQNCGRTLRTQTNRMLLHGDRDPTIPHIGKKSICVSACGHLYVKKILVNQLTNCETKDPSAAHGLSICTRRNCMSRWAWIFFVLSLTQYPESVRGFFFSTDTSRQAYLKFNCARQNIPIWFQQDWTYSNGKYYLANCNSFYETFTKLYIFVLL